LLGRLYSGGTGLGVSCNDRPLRIAETSEETDRTENSEDPEIADEIISLGGRGQYVSIGMPQVFDDLMRLHPRVRTYGDCFGHGLAIEGAIGAMVDFDLRIWDVAATQALVPEAGGKFFGWRQRGSNLIEARYDVIFGKTRVVDWIIRALRLT
jgi:fructose-1,6-bisphosphatase/inositol monophosphatase family enzyme